MKKVAFLIFTFLFTTPCFSQNKNTSLFSTNFIHSNKIDKNNIEMYFNNWGLTNNPYTHSGGFWNIPNEPQSREIVFDQGPWIVGKRNNEIVMSAPMAFRLFIWPDYQWTSGYVNSSGRLT